VKGEISWGASAGVADEAVVRHANAEDSILDTLVVEGVVARPDLSSDTSNVRASHGGTRDGVSAIRGTNPTSGNASSGGEDLAAWAEGGEGRAGVSLVSGHDSEGEVSRGGGEVAGVVVVVTSSDGHDETSAEGSISSIIDTLVAVATEGHVANNATTSASSISREVDTSNDASEGARAVGAEHLNADQVAALGQTISETASSGGNVSTVAVTIEETFSSSIE